jgi:hypothetical protein
MTGINAAADLELCRQHILELNAIETRSIARLLAYEHVTEADARHLAEIAAGFRGASDDNARMPPSADILPFPQRR